MISFPRKAYPYQISHGHFGIFHDQIRDGLQRIQLSCKHQLKVFSGDEMK